MPAGSFNLASDHTYRGGHSGDFIVINITLPTIYGHAVSQALGSAVHVRLARPLECTYLVSSLPVAVVEPHPPSTPMPYSVKTQRTLLHLPVLSHRVIRYPKKRESGRDETQSLMGA